MIKAVIFDMDGVIIDSEPLQSESLEIYFKRHGVTPIYHQNGLIQPVGLAGKETDLDLLGKHGITVEWETFKVERREIYQKILEAKLTLIDGFLDVVSILKAHKLKIGLASSRNLKNISFVITHLKIKKLFDVISGPTEGMKNKPAPDIYLQAIKELGLRPQECVAIEDSEPGIDSAHAAGMKIIAIPTSYTHRHNFSKADIIVENLSKVTIPLLQSL